MSDGAAPQAPPGRYAIIERLQAYSREPHRFTPIKGRPDVGYIARQAASALADELQALPADHSLPASLLRSAKDLAATDVAEPRLVAIYLALFEDANHAVVQRVRRTLRPFTILHMSCSPRLDRARASVASFKAAEGEQVGQITVVGDDHDHRYGFDAASATLRVPCPDDYEDLPAKMLGALFMLYVCGGVQGVLKVDDDHRLRDPGALAYAAALCAPSWQDAMAYTLQQGGRAASGLGAQLDKLCYSPRAFRSQAVAVALRRPGTGRTDLPVLMGQRIMLEHIGQHNRLWHHGKCRDKALGARPYKGLGARELISGAAGYLVNAAALRTLAYSWIFYEDHVTHGLYEDMVISSLIAAHDGRLVNLPMTAIVSAVEGY